MRISGITIPNEKKLAIGLTAVYGVGRSTVQKILASAKVDGNKKPADLSVDDENKIRALIEGMKVEGILKREISANINFQHADKGQRLTQEQSEETLERQWQVVVVR